MFKFLFKKQLASKWEENLTRPELWNKIKNTPLIQDGEINLVHKVMNETGWSESKTLQVIEEYRQFLYLTVVFGEAVPTKDVDIVFHSHILFTYDYFVIWPQILGRVIHHKPEVEGRENNYKSLFMKTEERKKSEFSSDSSSSVVPIPFSSCGSSSSCNDSSSSCGSSCGGAD